METIDIKIKLPAEITVCIPALSDVSFEDVAKAIAKDGVKLLQSIVHERVMAAFVAKHDSYLQEEVARLIADNEDAIRDLLTPKQ